MAVLTASELKTSWLQGLAGVGEDTYLGLVIARAEGAVARYIGFPSVAGAVPSLASGSYTRYGPEADSGIRVEGRNLYLEPRPVSACTQVWDDVNEEWDSTTLVATTDYTVYPWGLRLHPDSAHGYWSTEPHAIKVTFTAGWTLYPVDLVQAVGSLCRHWVQLRDRQGYSALPTQAGNAGLRDETLPDLVKELLAGLRLPSVLL